MERAERGPDIVAVLAEDHAEAGHLLEEAPGLSLEQRRAPTHAHPAAPHVGAVVKVAGALLLERPACWEPDDR